MGKKKIQKAPKTSKVEDDDEHSEPQVDQEPAQEPQAPKEPESPVANVGKKGRGKKSEVKQNKAEKVQKQTVLFSQEFANKVDSFKNFYKSYLEHKARSQNLNVTQQFEKVSNNVRTKIQSACSKVLKEDVSDAQKWIEDKILGIREQIQSVEKAQASTRQGLQTSGVFTAAEVQNQLTGIRKKKANFEQCIKDLEQVNERAVEIYKTDRMDQE